MTATRGMAMVLATVLPALTLACHDTAAPPNAQPPAAPAALVAGDTLLDTLTADTPALRFPYRASDSAWFTIFAQADYGQMSLNVTDSATYQGLAGAFVSPASGTNLLNNRCDDFLTLPGHTYLVTVRVNSLGDTGRFRLLLAPVDRRPEHHAAVIAVGDTVTGETLSNSADIDDFTFAGQAGEEVVLFLDVADSLPQNRVLATITGPDGDSLIASALNEREGGGLDSNNTGRQVLPADGTYRVTVSEFLAPAFPDQRFRGAYRFELYRVNRLPEHVSAAIVPDDTIESEAIDRPGDVDEFTLSGNAGDQFNLALVTPDSAGPAIYATLDSVTPQEIRLNAAGGRALATSTTGPFTLPHSGSYTVTVRGERDTFADYAVNSGPYRLFLYAVNPAPEIAPASFAVGDSVGTETIAFPGDVDRFFLTGTPDGLAELHAGTTGSVQGVLSITGIDPVADSVVYGGWAVSYAPQGLITIPAGGTLELDVATQPLYPGPVLYYGPYALSTVPINPAPEFVPAAYTFGDTVSTETIDPFGDIDRFTFDAAVGDTLDGFVAASHMGAVFLLTGPGDTLEFREEVGGALTPDTVAFYDPIHSSGPHVLQVSAGGTGPYAFALTRR